MGEKEKKKDRDKDENGWKTRTELRRHGVDSTREPDLEEGERESGGEEGGQESGQEHDE